MTLREKATLFSDLHRGPKILVLPNAWDAASARIFEVAGFLAIGTTSAGIAASLGYADGSNVPRAGMLEIVATIAAAVAVPVTADIESGYGDPVATAKAVVEAGAIGINLEDILPSNENTLTDLPTQTAILREIKSANLPLVINARTDIYLAAIGPPETRFRRTVERLNAYHEAGADCLFAPGVRDPETVAALAREVLGPLNILASAGSPSTAELQRLGVARVSVGSGPSRAALGLVRRIAIELLGHGTYNAMTADQIPYDELNRMLNRRP